MSYCVSHRHLYTPNAMSGRCLECDCAALRERIKAYEECDREFTGGFDAMTLAAEGNALRERVKELEQHREELIALVDGRTQGWREHAEKLADQVKSLGGIPCA